MSTSSFVEATGSDISNVEFDVHTSLSYNLFRWRAGFLRSDE
jgi:hypothetical protein